MIMISNFAKSAAEKLNTDSSYDYSTEFRDYIIACFGSLPK